MFPFEIPENLSALSAEEFAAFRTQVREFAQTTLADDAASAETLLATRELFTTVEAEDGRRTEQATAATAARAELAAGLAAPEATQPLPPAEPEPIPAPEPTGTEPIPALTASRTAPTGTLDTPPVAEQVHVGTLVASADAPGRLAEGADFSAVGVLLDRQFGRYGQPSASSRVAAPKRVKGANRFAMVNGRSMQRHSIAAVQREYPAEFRIGDGRDAMRVLEHARDESRLPGGSLAASALLRAEQRPAALTAAVGWCAPSEILYDLCSLSSLDGMLDIPTVQASRGGFQIPENGGPDFATIYDSIGDEGDVILTEYDVENGAEKVCVEVPCPPFIDVRLDVAYLCITGNLLQERGYPEAVTHFTQEALTALAHKVNASMIERLVAGSTAPVTIAEPSSSDDAATNLLAAVELAIMDMRYRNRMAFNTTVEVVFPMWVFGPMRAALSRNAGVSQKAITNAEIVSWFTLRGARPQFVYDWQDAFSGGTFGGSASATAFPTTVTFLVYPAGTWVKAEQDVISLDTIYDNALLTSNQFTALFVEDGLAALKMCRDSRLYTVDVNPAGVLACCP